MKEFELQSHLPIDFYFCDGNRDMSDLSYNLNLLAVRDYGINIKFDIWHHYDISEDCIVIYFFDEHGKYIDKSHHRYGFINDYLSYDDDEDGNNYLRIDSDECDSDDDLLQLIFKRINIIPKNNNTNVQFLTDMYV